MTHRRATTLDRIPRIDPPPSDSTDAVSTVQLENLLGPIDLGEDFTDLITKDPRSALERMFCVKSVLTTGSSFAERHRQAQFDTRLQKFSKIGTGSCGEVFQRSGTIDVLKVSRNDDRGKELWNDYVKHTEVSTASKRSLSSKSTSAFRKPANDLEWWTQNVGKFPDVQVPQDTLSSERIMPLHEGIRHSLINLYCHPRLIEKALAERGNADYLARVLLGKQTDSPNKKSAVAFTLRNFPLRVDYLTNIGLQPKPFAITMGQTLSVMHWRAHCDARDVEFVLGSAPVVEEITAKDLAEMPPRTNTSHTYNFKRRTTHLWMVDFNLVNSITMDQAGVKAAVSASLANDPYYPRPLSMHPVDQQLWSDFKAAYLETSRKLMTMEELSTGEKPSWGELPTRFIESVVSGMQNLAQEREKAAKRTA